MVAIKVGGTAPDSRVYSCSSCGYLNAMLKDELFGACPVCFGAKKPHAWSPTKYEILIKTKNIAKEVERRSTWADKVSDRITAFCGNMKFVYFHILWFGLWIWYNTFKVGPFDPFPFGLLTLIVSLEAIVLATFILITQNRQSEIGNLRSELDYQVNLKAEKAITEVNAKISEIYNKLVKKE